ncbi:hypothetical protein SPD48_13050 [Pseudogracilibacillus sp. SE30717A]|uniref:hypothetical protein n=1 Tax=Pseudogracilibacillus sp. SE30717A TaxID=3098293 RepID=UPI00300E519B
MRKSSGKVFIQTLVKITTIIYLLLLITIQLSSPTNAVFTATVTYKDSLSALETFKEEEKSQSVQEKTEGTSNEADNVKDKQSEEEHNDKQQNDESSKDDLDTEQKDNSKTDPQIKQVDNPDTQPQTKQEDDPNTDPQTSKQKDDPNSASPDDKLLENSK